MKTILKIEGFDQIQINSFQQQVTQPVSALSRTGGRTGVRCDFSDVTIEKEIDNITPQLFLYCCSGKHIPEAIIESYNNKEGVIFSIIISDVIITSQFLDDKKKEVLTMAYGKIKLLHLDDDSVKTSSIWNLEMNKAE